MVESVKSLVAGLRARLAKGRRGIFWTGVVATLAPLGNALLIIIGRAGDVDFLITRADVIGDFLSDYWEFLAPCVGFVLIWVSLRQETSSRGASAAEAERVRSMERLRQTTLDAIRKFEALSRAYELAMVEVYGPGVYSARLKLMHSLSEVITSAIATIPAEQRYQYESLLRYMLLDYAQFYDDKKTDFADDLPPIYAITLALGMHKPKPSEDPPPSKASEQSPPP